MWLIQIKMCSKCKVFKWRLSTQKFKIWHKNFYLNFSVIIFWVFWMSTKVKFTCFILFLLWLLDSMRVCVCLSHIFLLDRAIIENCSGSLIHQFNAYLLQPSSLKVLYIHTKCLLLSKSGAFFFLRKYNLNILKWKKYYSHYH